MSWCRHSRERPLKALCLIRDRFRIASHRISSTFARVGLSRDGRAVATRSEVAVFRDGAGGPELPPYGWVWACGFGLFHRVCTFPLRKSIATGEIIARRNDARQRDAATAVLSEEQRTWTVIPVYRKSGYAWV